MLNMFSSFEETSQLMQFITFKFESEIKAELDTLQKSKEL